MRVVRLAWIFLLLLIVAVICYLVFAKTHDEKPRYDALICKKCLSARKWYDGEWFIVHAGQKYSTCEHEWVNEYYGVTVPMNTIVLVRKKELYGAFILRRGKNYQNKDFEWYYRTDGKGLFDPSDPAVKSGKSSGPVTFGQFFVFKSCYNPTKDSVHYPQTPEWPLPPPADELRLCVTNETSVLDIDATNAKWVYKASSVDPGVPGGVAIPEK